MRAFCFLLLSLFSILSTTLSQPPRSVYIDCGASEPTQFNGHQWLPDTGFVSSGTPKNVTNQDVLIILSTVRSFASEGNLNKKFCYEIPVLRFEKYLVRTTYYYGGVNGNLSPPVFDQIVDGTFWSVVNTTDDYAKNLSSYYEGVFRATGKNMSVCLGVNSYTDSDPFISAIELIMLADSVYNSTNFNKFALGLVARHSFGYNGSIIRYPDDRFDRLWQPFGSRSPVAGVPNISLSGIWNLPPLKIFDTQLEAGNLQPFQLRWPQQPLPNSTYYIALYFANDHMPSSEISRVFSISINGVAYYNNLNVTSSGLVVFATQWPLAGPTNITLTPATGSHAGPVINAGEIFDVLLLGRTHTRDAIALESVKSSLRNPPPDWNGDPCLPVGYSWSGITCSSPSMGPRIRVVSLNLMNMGLSGSLSPYVANLTAINSILLGKNNLSGPIPDLHTLRHLQILGLENNQFIGAIPSSLGDISSLLELHLENNNLTGAIPSSLIGKPGLNFTYAPGNKLLSPAPPPAP
ncbi:hypothetical protein Nepgr_030315 [Nepenthes gracilis]|uniref:Uncharacterized protein n=1 Tax=Nepenthes gracilis TaxID=150966 RepID=A0AAD3TGR8_NEPGR|nr:hypothetical protein Nepgr_030315 [Nepenthes gracilis]